MSIIKEFKDFAVRGNVVDLAVGIIIGGAFGTIVGSLVNDVLMPPIGILIGGMDFSSLAIPLNDKASINYGKFINAIINFTIVAFAIFMLVKGINKLKRETPPPPLADPKPTPEQNLLSEIRDILKNKN